MTWEEFQYQCYLLARYQEELRAEGTFDTRATELITEGLSFSDGVAFLESMISHGEAYARMDKEHCPILIYVGDPICYGVLDHFAKQLGFALDRRGYLVEFFDPNGENVSGISRFAGKRFRAIIGFQTFAFSVEMKDGRPLHDLIDAPKFNIIFDHPVWLKKHLENPKKDFYVLTIDPNYVRFVERYFKEVKRTFLFAPAGDIYETEDGVLPEKTYDLTFVGTYNDWRQWDGQREQADKLLDGLASLFFDFMKAHPCMTWEDGLRALITSPQAKENQYAANAAKDDGVFSELLFIIKPVCFMVMSYFREKVLDAIVEADIPMHVFGESFDCARYRNAKNFIRHPELSPAESLEVYAKSKISLNIMSWHKAGMTERLSNMMLNRAVVVTDKTAYLEENYVAGEDFLSFDLTEISDLSRLLKDILHDEARQKTITENAYQKAIARETWDNRAAEFERILNTIENGEV